MKKLSIIFFCLLSFGVADCQGQLAEDFEAFELGALEGQMGWSSEAGAQIVDTGIEGFGSRTIRAFNVGPNDGEYLRSPTLDSSGYGTIEFDLKIDDLDPIAEYLVFTFFEGGNTQRLHFHPGGLMTLDQSVGSCLVNDFLIGGTWSTSEVMNISWTFMPDPQGSVVTQHIIVLDNEIIFEGSNVLGCGFDDEMDSFGIWSTGSFPADVSIDNFLFLPFVVLGDINGDGIVNLLDVSPFVDLITTGEFQALQPVGDTVVADRASTRIQAAQTLVSQ